MKTIQLTQGKETVVDDADYEYLSQWKWHYSNGYAASTQTLPGGKGPLSMHRCLLCPPSGFHVDHINGDKLDNRRQNLRLCDNGGNMRNRGAQRVSRSGICGVVWDRGKWQANIWHGGKKFYLGRFRNALDASRAYDDAVDKYHGAFGRKNNLLSLTAEGIRRLSYATAGTISQVDVNKGKPGGIKLGTPSGFHGGKQAARKRRAKIMREKGWTWKDIQVIVGATRQELRVWFPEYNKSHYKGARV